MNAGNAWLLESFINVIFTQQEFDHSSVKNTEKDITFHVEQENRSKSI